MEYIKSDVASIGQVIAWSLSISLVVFFVIFGIRTGNTILFESENDFKIARVPVCVEYDYDKSGESCMGYEYRYEEMGVRVANHLSSSLSTSVVILIASYWYLWNERQKALGRWEADQKLAKLKAKRESSPSQR